MRERNFQKSVVVKFIVPVINDMCEVIEVLVVHCGTTITLDELQCFVGTFFCRCRN